MVVARLMEEPKEDRGIFALVPIVLFLVVFRFNQCTVRWEQETAAHPDTWPLRQLLFLALGIPGWVVVRHVWRLDKETDPLWRRILHLTVAFAGVTLVMGALILVDNNVP